MFDEFLNIQTEGREDNQEGVWRIYYRYAPTDYSFLEEIFQKYPFCAENH